MADNPQKSGVGAAVPAAAKPDSPHVANLRRRREELVKDIERIAAMPEHRDHDHDQALKRRRDGIAELDREIKNAQ